MHEWLEFDREKEVEKIGAVLRMALVSFKRRGYVLGVSGGIDSSVVLALCVSAVGRDKVVTLQMPERHSAEETLGFSEMVINLYGVPTFVENITPLLEAVDFYGKYSAALTKVIPAYGPGWTSKIVSSNVFDKKGITTFHAVAQSPEGVVVRERLPLREYLEIVAATNYKQRARKMVEYYHADRLNYADIGTPNRLEYDQGFFVKIGDGSADVKPIAHLYKSQVYALAEYLGVPEAIRKRLPTTDTYSMPQGQDEFYFSLSYELMDLCLFGKNAGKSYQEVAKVTGLTPDQVALVYKDIDVKRATTSYLHAGPVLVESVAEVKL